MRKVITIKSALLMKKIGLPIAAAIALMLSNAAHADQPADKPAQGVGNSIELPDGIIGDPKNLGQLNKAVRETGIFSGRNVPQDGRFFGQPVDDWIHEQVLGPAGRGRNK